MPNEESDRIDNYYDRLAAAILSAAENDEIVTKWTVAIEVLDGNGDKGLWAFSDEHSSIWDVLGMLAFATQKAKSRVDMVTWAQSSISVDDDEDDEED